MWAEATDVTHLEENQRSWPVRQKKVGGGKKREEKSGGGREEEENLSLFHQISYRTFAWPS